MTISIKFIKDMAIDTVKKITLKDMGFKYDVHIFNEDDLSINNDKLDKICDKLFLCDEFRVFDIEKEYIKNLLKYKNNKEALLKLHKKVKCSGVTLKELELYLISRSLGGLEKNHAEKILGEFIYLIQTIIPRDIQDLFYFIGLDTNGAYWVFFDVAVEQLGFERYAISSKGRKFNQIKHYPETRIREMILEEKSLQEIYDTTCATKTMIKQVINRMNIKEFGAGQGSKGERLIEAILLDLKLSYKREVSFGDFKKVTKEDFNGRYDFVVYENKKPNLIIEFDGEQHFKFVELFHRDLKGFEYQKHKDKIKDLYCKIKEITIIRIPYNKIHKAKKTIQNNLNVS